MASGGGVQPRPEGVGPGLGDVSLRVKGRERRSQPGQRELGSSRGAGFRGVLLRGKRGKLPGTRCLEKEELAQESLVDRVPVHRLDGLLKCRLKPDSRLPRGGGGGGRDSVHQQCEKLLLAGQLRRQASYLLALRVLFLASLPVSPEELVDQGHVINVAKSGGRGGRGGERGGRPLVRQAPEQPASRGGKPAAPRPALVGAGAGPATARVQGPVPVYPASGAPGPCPRLHAPRQSRPGGPAKLPDHLGARATPGPSTGHSPGGSCCLPRRPCCRAPPGSSRCSSGPPCARGPQPCAWGC